jgi:hypothetical protein
LRFPVEARQQQGRAIRLQVGKNFFCGIDTQALQNVRTDFRQDVLEKRRQPRRRLPLKQRNDLFRRKSLHHTRSLGGIKSQIGLRQIRRR